MEFVKNNINYTDLYTTVYHFSKVENGRVDFNSAIIDKIFIDVDSKEELKKIQNIIEKTNWKKTMLFSGRGFHLYIFIEPINGIEGWLKKLAIQQWVKSNLVEKFDLSVDRVVIGDLARITRITNTFNFKGGRYCIPLDKKLIFSSYENIQEMAKRQTVNWEFFGDELVKLPIPKIDENGYYKDILKNLDYKNMNIVVNNFPPFLKKIIDRKREKRIRGRGWADRTVMILWLKEMGHTLSETVAWLKNNIPDDEFKHCVFEERQPQYIYMRESINKMFFPSLDCLKREGFDITEEDVEFFKKNILYFENEQDVFRFLGDKSGQTTTTLSKM